MKHLIRSFTKRRVGALAPTLVIIACGYHLIGHLARSQPVFVFIPACQEYEYPDDSWYMGYDSYRFIKGEPTQEFWRIVLEYFDQFEHFNTDRWPQFRSRDGKLFVALENYLISIWPFNQHDSDHEKEDYFFHVSSSAAFKIYDARVAAGEINDSSMTNYMVVRRLSRAPAVRRHPDECGFMEELIMKGGRFAGE